MEEEDVDGYVDNINLDDSDEEENSEEASTPN
jgi:hypothetical protein